ncbi:MAG: glycine--tRNA ligase [Candidatus Bathyarchaeota archaeon]|nr:glycine--tRNA ligase [Candidatus Bathyarchaeota archaeon]
MKEETRKQDKFTIISELARRRGFYWQSYEIYGGVSGFATYGPLGARLKQNIERKLRELFVDKLGVLEIESPVITPEKVFVASGHVEHFREPMVECVKCKKRFRADHLLEEVAGVSEAEAEKMSLDELSETLKKNSIQCPECGGALGEPKQFLTMFKTTIGPYSEAVGYGRPEAAQGIFVEFRRLYEMAREKIPFGVLQIGHALRNEISPRQGLLRVREFTIADLEFFFDPEEPDCHLLKEVKDEMLRLVLAEHRLKGSEKITEVSVAEALKKGYVKSEWHAVFMAYAKKLLIELGVSAENQRFIEKLPWERAHYSSQSFDQQVLVERWGWVEVSGHAYRGDYDLKQHAESSGVDMCVFKEYEKPVEREQLVIKPLMANLGPVFKNEAGKVAELLSKADPQEVEVSLKKEGFFKIGKYKILPEHINVLRQKTVERGRRFIPHVVEPSFGSDRLLYVALEYAYRAKEDRALLNFPPDIAPIQLGVYPLVSKDGLPEKALALCRELVDEGFVAEYDEAGSIGRRYARADEVGIPLGVTVDYDTLKDGTVTVRDRDSWKQVRSPSKDLPQLLHRYFRKKIGFDALGAPI